MLKKPLKKSSAVFFINLHVSTKVRYVAATLAPDSLLNPPKFFLRFVNGRMALSLALSKLRDNATYPNFSFIPTFNGLYSNKLISWCIFSFEIEKVVIKMCIFYTFPKYRRNKQTSRTWKSWNNHEVSGYNNKAAISRISYIGGREKLLNDKAMETAKCRQYPWLLQFHLIFLSQLFGYVYS